MVTKYNTGDIVMVPARIVSAREEDGAIVYDVDMVTWRVPEADVQLRDGMTNSEVLDFLRAIDRPFVV